MTTPLPVRGDTEGLVVETRGLTERFGARCAVDHVGLREVTVKTHVSHVLLELELRDCVQAVVLAYELGLVAPGSAG